MLIFAIILSLSVWVFDAKAEEETSKEGGLDTILDKLQGLTCETDGVGNLLRTEFSHTCIPAPFSTFAVANIISPVLYANTFLRVDMNDPELFPGACNRGNRLDFNDPILSFSMCNNRKLAKARVGAISKVSVVIAKSIITGDDPWEDIKNAWKLPKKDYHITYNGKEGTEGMMVDIGVIPVFPWKIIKENDRLCVATQSFNGWVPIGCKYIKEPYPVSIYSDFMDVSPEGIKELSKLPSLTSCGNMGGCYKRAYDHSRTGIVMTGPLIECVKEMVAKLMISNSVCSFDDVQQVLGSDSRYSSALFQFQQNMHRIVSALLTIYVILFGFKMVLSGDVPPKSELINFVIKFLFVVYFSVGININVGSGDDLDRMDGMVQWAFPFLLNGMSQIASWIINASPSGLCRFDDVYYPEGLEHLKLWDALDCKISHYLGLDMMQTMIVENASRHHNWDRLDILSFPIPPYIYLLIGGFISGYFQLVTLALMYPLLVISVGAFIVNATVVCMISIVVLGVLAPLFVPLYLFNYTRGYFDAWVKLLISFLLQPMIAVVFMTTMLSIYDLGFYGTCKYVNKDFTYSGPEFKVSMGTGIGNVSAGLDGRTVRYSYLDQDWNNSYSNDEEKRKCRESLGFILNNPLQFLFDVGDSLAEDAVMPWIEDASGEEDKKRFSFLDAIKSAPGMFFNMIEVIFEKIRTLAMSMFTACFVLYLMYHFSESLANFAADMTEGISISNMSIKPQDIFKAGNAISSALGGKMSTESANKAASVARGSSDKLSTDGGSSSSDKISTDADVTTNITGKLSSTVKSDFSVDKNVKSSVKNEDVKQENTDSDKSIKIKNKDDGDKSSGGEKK